MKNKNLNIVIICILFILITVSLIFIYKIYIENTYNIILFNYAKENFVLEIKDEDGSIYSEYHDTVDIKIINRKEYQNKIFRVIIMENPIRNQFLNNGKYLIKIKQKILMQPYIHSSDIDILK